MIADDSARFGRAARFESGLAFKAHGTSAELRWRLAESAASSWLTARFNLSTGLAETKRIEFGAGPIIVDEVAVYDLSLNRLAPPLALGLAAAVLLLGTAALAFRERLR